MSLSEWPEVEADIEEEVDAEEERYQRAFPFGVEEYEGSDMERLISEAEYREDR